MPTSPTTSADASRRVGRVLRLTEVLRLTGRSRTSWYEDIAGGRAPRPIRIGPQAVGWLEADIDQWFANRLAVRAAEAEAENAERAAREGGSDVL